MADAWGGSWGTPSAWGDSWGSGVAPPAIHDHILGRVYGKPAIGGKVYGRPAITATVRGSPAITGRVTDEEPS